MNLNNIATVKELLSKKQKIVIIPHKNPDGDAIGSTLGLWHYLKGIHQEAVIISPNDYPEFLKWMPGNEEIVNYESHSIQAKKYIAEATLIFTLDFNLLSRAGQLAPLLEASTADFCMIDHHQQPDDYAIVTYSDTSMSSTCEMVYNFLDYLDATDKVTPEIANCLYTGIMTDTGSFRYSATTANTHRITANLIEKGANNAAIHNAIYDNTSPNRLHLLGCALKNIVILPEFSTAYITLSQEELDTYNYQKGDTEGIVNYGLTIKDIIFAVIFIENKEEGIVKISFRSQGDFSVNQFARKHFQGGGHDNAAGGKSDVSLQETTAHFTDLLKTYKKELKS